MDNVYPIWTPRDAIDTANDFHAELDRAERGVAVDEQARTPLTKRP